MQTSEEISRKGRGLKAHFQDVSINDIELLPYHDDNNVESIQSHQLQRMQSAVDIIQSLPSHNLPIMKKKESNANQPVVIDRTVSSQVEDQVERIVNELEKDTDFMDDNPVSNQIRIETIRDMPESLTFKRKIKFELANSSRNQKSGAPITVWKNIKYNCSMSLRKFDLALKNLAYAFELWYSSLKVIEGHFGSGVATYFKFFRWLFLLNILVFIISFSFVVVPQILYSEGGVFTRLNEASDEQPASCSKSETLWTIKDIFSGEGSFTNSILFYGYYTNSTFSIISKLKYNMPFAYFFSFVFCYLCVFVVLSLSMAKSYRKSFIETKIGVKNIYANKVFCGWDFRIATESAADLKSKSIFNELKELLAEDDQNDMEQSCLESMFIFFKSFGVHMLSLIIVASSGALVWLLLDQVQPERIYISLVITLLSIFVPLFFSWIIRFENYRSPRSALHITLIRTYLLEVAVMGVLLVYWLKEAGENFCCWETSLGQEVYRLMIMDFLISIIGTWIAAFIHHKIYLKLWKEIGVPEFDIAFNSLNLIYNQTLFFIGFFFSPLLGGIVIVKMFITFYIKKNSLLQNFQPSSRPWRAAQTQTVFLVLSFLSLLFVVIAFGYIFTRIEPSECGPFRGKDRIYSAILVELGTLDDFWIVIAFLTKPGIVAFVLITMGVLVYYLRARAFAHMEMVNLLRDMILVEAKDKEFLLQNISKAAEGDSLYGRRFKKMSLPSSTLRFRTATKPKNKRKSQNNPDIMFPSSSYGFPEIEDKSKDVHEVRMENDELNSRYHMPAYASDFLSADFPETHDDQLGGRSSGQYDELTSRYQITSDNAGYNPSDHSNSHQQLSGRNKPGKLNRH